MIRLNVACYKIRGILKSFVLVLSVAMGADCFALDLTDIKVIEKGYSYVTLRAKINYDGHLGNGIMMGVIANSDQVVRGAGYMPTPIQINISDVDFKVDRPFVENLLPFSTKELVVTAYNQKESMKFAFQFAIDWPGFADFFEIKVAAESKLLRGSYHIKLNEQMFNFRSVVSSLVEMGVKPEDIAFHSVSLVDSTKAIVELYVPETILKDDLYLLTDALLKNELKIAKFHFIKIEDKDFDTTAVAVLRPGLKPGKDLPKEVLADAVLKANIDPVFAFYGIEPNKEQDLSLILLEKAIQLNDQESRASGEKAKGILDDLMARDYKNPRVYSELARSISRIHGDEESLEQRRNILKLSLNLFPDNQWALTSLINIEASLGNYEEGIRYIQEANKHAKELDVWLFVHSARLYRDTGDHEKANENFEKLLTFKDLNATNKRAQYYGLTDYADLLASNNSNSVADVYKKIVDEFPERGKCMRLKLGDYMLKSNVNLNEVRSTLSLASTSSCKGIGKLITLMALQDWYTKEQSKSELYKISIQYGDLTDLIFQAAQFKNGKELLASITKNDLKIDSRSGAGYTALHLASQSGNHLWISNLLDNGADIDALSQEGLTPLMYAVVSGKIDAVSALIKGGANISIKSKYGFGALELAKRAGNVSIVTLLGNKEA